MALRTALVFAVLALAACSSGDSGEAGKGEGGSAAPAQTVPCALAGAREFTAKCSLERAQLGGQSVITLRHPDGGFRRLVSLDGGKRFAAADGYAEAVIEANGAEIEVTLGDDHYLLPVPAEPVAAKR